MAYTLLVQPYHYVCGLWYAVTTMGGNVACVACLVVIGRIIINGVCVHSWTAMSGLGGTSPRESFGLSWWWSSRAGLTSQREG